MVCALVSRCRRWPRVQRCMLCTTSAPGPGLIGGAAGLVHPRADGATQTLVVTKQVTPEVPNAQLSAGPTTWVGVGAPLPRHPSVNWRRTVGGLVDRGTTVALLVIE